MSRMKIRITSLLLFSVWISVFQSGCSGPRRFTAPDPIPGDRKHVPMPHPREIHTYAEYFDKQIIIQLDESLDLARQLRNIAGNRKEAKNVDAYGEVPNSSWFTNRNGHQALSIAGIARGPDTGNGPDTSGFWTVTRAKVQGVTPGFSIRDSKGDNYLLKFDPIGYPELASGAEVVSTKLFYAAGYNTPENYIVYFHPDILKLGAEVKYTDHKGHKRFMNQSDLTGILNGIQKEPDGRIRALASKYLPGKPIGPFRYRGIRKDDLNDFIPHHHRRELRGLRIIAAWLNHFDTKDGNSLDVYVTENGKSYVKHYLIDFGATLGSASHGPNHLWRGHQHDVDPEVIMQNLVSLGLHVRAWEKQGGVVYPSVGIYDAELFNPIAYKGQVPNPAFENMTSLDGYWAAKIVTSFSDEQIETAVEQGRYTDPEAAAYLAETIKKRRDKIGEYFFKKIAPLDNFEISEDESGPVLEFEDLAVSRGLEDPRDSEYNCRFFVFGKSAEKLPERPLGRQTSVPLAQLISLPDEMKQKRPDSNLQIAIELRVKRSRKSDWSKKVTVYLEPDPVNNDFRIIGVKHED